MCCLCRHLRLCSDAAQDSIFPPLVVIPNLVQGCGMEWVRLELLLSCDCGSGLCRLWELKQPALPLEVWATSGALFEQTPTLADTAPPGPPPRPLSSLCIPRSNLFSGPVCPRSSAKLWCGVGRARAFTCLGTGDHGVLVAGVLVAALLLLEIWAASVVLFE